MTLGKQFINLLGVLVVVVVVVAGGALIALPMYSQFQTIVGNTATAAQTNSLYQAQIDALSAADENIEGLDADIAALRTQIATSPQLDDVHEIIDRAAEKSDIRIVSVKADEVEPWLPRTGVDTEAKAATPVSGTDPSAETESSAEEPADAVVTADKNDTGTSSTKGAAKPAETQRQLLLTIEIDVALPYAVAPDGDEPVAADDDTEGAEARAAATAQAQKAADFVDALGVGPRLISPIDVAYSGTKLTVTVLAYFQVEES